MQAGAALLDPGADLASCAAQVRADQVRTIVDDLIAPDVDRIDREGLYPAEALRALGQAGAYASHLARHTHHPARRLSAAIADMATVGATCMSTAFCVWCQDTCGWYLEQTENAALRHRLQPGIAHGLALGGTGLSNPVKALAGMEPFRLRGTRVQGGWIVTGALPWVSNLGENHWFGSIFEDSDQPGHRIMAMFQCGTNDVAIKQNVHFIALEGTGTYSVRIRRSFVPDDHILADPIETALPRIRPGFVLLQTGMGFGVISGAIAGMRRDDVTHGHTNRFLPQGADEFEADAAELWTRVADLADHPGQGRDYLRAVLQARLAVSELTLAATQAGILHGGARAYVEGSAVARRQREGNFVAIITPSIRQLHQEIASLSSH